MTRIFLVLLTLTFIMPLSYGQSKPNIDSVILNSTQPSYSKLTFLSDCEKAKDIAEHDIGTNNMRLFIIGGIAPVTYSGDDAFERRYRIKYYDYGCISPRNECLQLYNSTIFQHLYIMYGKSWKHKVRPDVVGLKKYKRKR